LAAAFCYELGQRPSDARSLMRLMLMRLIMRRCCSIAPPTICAGTPSGGGLQAGPTAGTALGASTGSYPWISDVPKAK